MVKEELVRRVYDRTHGLYTQRQLSALLIDIFTEIGHIVLDEENTVKLRGFGKFWLSRTELQKDSPINTQGVCKHGKKVVFSPGTFYRRVYEPDTRDQRDRKYDESSDTSDQNSD